jgi:hypothetical protein
LGLSEIETRLLGLILDEYAQNSIFGINIEEDFYRYYYNITYKLISKQTTLRSASELPDLLLGVTGIESIAIFSSPPSHFFIDRRQAAAHLIDELALLFRNAREMDSILRFHRGGSVASKPLWAATTFAKPQFFESAGSLGTGRYCAFFPIYHAEQVTAQPA